MVQILPVPIQSDNYSYILTTPNVCIIVDPTVARPLVQRLEACRVEKFVILNTHHHYDHTAGNSELKRRFNARIVAPKDVSGSDSSVCDGEVLSFGDVHVEVVATPGHTRSGVSYYIQAQNDFPGALFTGDTVFVGGCGRLFEGTAGDLWTSFKKLREYPDETLVYCGHDYAEENYAFALSLTPDDVAVKTRYEEIKNADITVPSTIAQEKATNPFMRCDDPAFADSVGLLGMPPAEIFGKLRQKKDEF